MIFELVDDANELVWAAEDMTLDEVQADAVALLALVAGQDVEPGDRPGRWRIAIRTAPDRVVSTVDPESRHVHKTQHAYRDGFKAHVAAEPDTGLITATGLTAGNVGDATAAAGLVADEPAGTEVLGDSAYGAGEFREHLDNEQMRAVIKPPPLRPAVPGGYTIDDFDIDEEGQTVTCPAGPPCGSRRRGTRRSGPDARRVRSERDALPPSTGARSSCIRNIVSSPPRE